MEPQQNGIKTWQWVVTVIVIIALVVIGILVFGSKGTGAPTTTGENPTPTNETPVSINRITMNDQYPGNVVFLNSVQLANSGWVVIQTDKDGQPDKIIGSTHFGAGINAGGKVTLNQSMIDGSTYYAVIYTDDASGTFSATADQPLKDSDGRIIMHIFKASSSVSAGLKG